MVDLLGNSPGDPPEGGTDKQKTEKAPDGSNIAIPENATVEKFNSDIGTLTTSSKEVKVEKGSVRAFSVSFKDKRGNSHFRRFVASFDPKTGDFMGYYEYTEKFYYYQGGSFSNEKAAYNLLWNNSIKYTLEHIAYITASAVYVSSNVYNEYDRSYNIQETYEKKGILYLAKTNEKILAQIHTHPYGNDNEDYCSFSTGDMWSAAELKGRPQIVLCRNSSKKILMGKFYDGGFSYISIPKDWTTDNLLKGKTKLIYQLKYGKY